jgi:hypothetical protein
MHLISRATGKQARDDAGAPKPFGPGFPVGALKNVETLEVWGSEFKDPGPDFTEFRVFDAKGLALGTRRVEGY